MVRCAQYRAASATPSQKSRTNRKALAWATGASMGEEAVLADSGRVGEIAASGWAGEKDPRSGRSIRPHPSLTVATGKVECPGFRLHHYEEEGEWLSERA